MVGSPQPRESTSSEIKLAPLVPGIAPHLIPEAALGEL